MLTATIAYLPEARQLDARTSEITRPAFEATLDIFQHAGLITKRHSVRGRRCDSRLPKGVGQQQRRQPHCARRVAAVGAMRLPRHCARYQRPSRAEHMTETDRLDRRRQHGPPHEPAPGGGRPPARRRRRDEHGARRRRTPSAPRATPRSAARAETIILSLPDGNVSEAVAREIAARLAAQVKTVIDTSTIGIKAAEAVAAILTAAGIDFVDAPVSGGTAGADKATLAIMLACPARQTYERFEAADEPDGQAVLCGPQGGPGPGRRSCSTTSCRPRRWPQPRRRSPSAPARASR